MGEKRRKAMAAGGPAGRDGGDWVEALAKSLDGLTEAIRAERAALAAERDAKD